MIFLILAKSEPKETLIEHTENTLKVFKSIKETFPEVPELCNVPEFWENLFYALFFHDFGKAAYGFQNSLETNSFWNYRHEILSASFLTCLDNAVSPDSKKAIAMAIITHHKDVLVLREKYHTISDEGLRIYSERLEELKPNFDELISYLDLIPSFSEKYLGYKLEVPIKIEFSNLENIYLDFVQPYFFEYDDEEFTKLHGSYGIFLKGFINACDYLASSSTYEILAGIEDMKKIYPFESLRKTQELSSKTKGSAFLIAPTGSGKTESSLFWSDFNQNKNHSKRVFYFLPYTASINAMYKRLIRDFQNEDLVGLLHGKSSYFLYKSFEDLSYDESRDKVKNIKGLTKKIYRPYKILTPFQIIKYFFGVKGFEMGLSELAGSLIILDEIHAYDAHTTSLFLEILKVLKKDFGVSIFIMSATLPSFLLKIFKESLGINALISLDDNELDLFTRHRVHVLEGSIENYFNTILKDLNDGKRVLIVCNTVKKSQFVFEWFKSKNVSKMSLLHSRFILKDRESIESNLDDLNLLIGTQAIEVSLDISYDVLYTEPAPLDALIQRFGRINRKGWEEHIIKDVNVMSQGSDLDKFIYNQDLVFKTVEVLKKEDILYESKIQNILDLVYAEGYDSKDQENFDSVSKHFSSAYNNLIPFINPKDSANLFNSLFDSVEVIPQKFKEEYLEKIENKEFYEAMAYTLSISKRKFFGLIQNNNIEFMDDSTFVNLKYDSELGLLDEEESNIF